MTSTILPENTPQQNMTCQVEVHYSNISGTKYHQYVSVELACTALRCCIFSLVKSVSGVGTVVKLPLSHPIHCFQLILSKSIVYSSCNLCRM